ncbi:hypothetical protein FVN29_08415 [Campylobacter jejuni]|nr:hypothetical protein [Campylobacter jejuni]
MKNTIKLALLGAVITGVFSACSSEPKTVQYYEDPNEARYSKSFDYKPQISTKELMQKAREQNKNMELK